jgi:c-di-GMP-binding flagellar brake protein YcgR
VRALDAMREDGDAVAASLESGEALFLSRLLEVEPRQGTLVLACSDHKHANSALLAVRRVRLRCNHRGAHYEFSADEPRETEFQGQAALRLQLPDALVAFQRRAHARFAVPPRVPLRCEISLGALSFDADVVDVSLGGIGALVYDDRIRLDPGTRIERARIRHPLRAPVVADLEIRHVSRVLLPDGRAANRAGCRILAAAADLEDLIRLFVTQLGE